VELHRLRQKREQKKKQGNIINGKRRASSINVKKRVQTLNDLRAGKLLSYFTKHFITMARSSNEYRSYPQAYMYLLLAGNMATLLDENNNSSEAYEFRQEIQELNVASRGGVQDMLGSSWTMNDNCDLIPGNQALRGSNWELKKENQPLPTPPKDKSPVSTVKAHHQNHLRSIGSSLSKIKNNSIAKPNIENSISQELSDDITELPESFENRGTSSDSTYYINKVITNGYETTDTEEILENETSKESEIIENKISDTKIFIADDDDDFGDTYL
ncbi:hypothetical protein SK128_023890, partial [Halocaridina rubra]